MPAIDAWKYIMTFSIVEKSVTKWNHGVRGGCKVGRLREEWGTF